METGGEQARWLPDEGYCHDRIGSFCRLGFDENSSANSPVSLSLSGALCKMRKIFILRLVCLLQYDGEGNVPRCLKSLQAAYHGLTPSTCLVHSNIISLELTPS